MSNGDGGNEVLRPLGTSLSRAAIVVLLFGVAALVEAARLFSLRSYDIWEHLRLGSWMLANRTWPTTGLFSQAANFPWRDFNWLGDLTMAAAYRVLGLSAVPAMWMLYRFLLAVVAFLLAGGARGKFWLPVALSVVAQYLLFGLGPIAGGASAVFFAVELWILMECRHTGKYRQLFWLPPLFVLWANIDWDFVYGIGLLAIFLVALSAKSLVERNEDQRTHKEELQSIALAAGACVLATLLSPYSYHSYGTFFAVQASPANRYIFEYTAMTFHQPQDYTLLLLTMAAFLSLGLRRSRDLFLITALMISVALSFYAQGDNWLAVLVAIAVIGHEFAPSRMAPVEQKRERDRWMVLPAAGALALVLLSYAIVVPHERSVLLQRVAENLPVRACDYIRQNRLPAPLFNTQTWGSFLTWYLPEYPVAIDARRKLYPDDWETDYFRVMKVLAPYQDFAPMMQARTLLLYRQSVMGEALRGVVGFRVAYEDNLAIVLVHETQARASAQELGIGPL
jgi:hypothetical protein